MSIKKHILETKSLAVGYQQNKSVAIIQQDINLQLLAGEFVTILGKNGIGKSTLQGHLPKYRSQFPVMYSYNKKRYNRIV